MAQAWFYNSNQRLPTDASQFNSQSNLMLIELGNQYASRFSNGTLAVTESFVYVYDYIPVAEANSLFSYLVTASDGRAIDLPDYSVAGDGSVKKAVFITDFNKVASSGSTMHWTFTINFRGAYE